VGKTVVSAAIMRRLRDHAPKYWKPIQTGCEVDDDTRDVVRLSGCGAEGVLDDGVRLPRPLSPHAAARLEGRVITLEPLLELWTARAGTGIWVVEGAGGVLVPINVKQLMIDLMVELGLPVVVVARAGLGTINHTLLTLDALRRRSLRIAGVVMVGEPNAGNRVAIEEYGGVAVLGELPTLTPLTPDALGSWVDMSFDNAGRLAAATA
jgi:dethiobiotin synthase